MKCPAPGCGRQRRRRAAGAAGEASRPSAIRACRRRTRIQNHPSGTSRTCARAHACGVPQRLWLLRPLKIRRRSVRERAGDGGGGGGGGGEGRDALSRRRPPGACSRSRARRRSPRNHRLRCWRARAADESSARPCARARRAHSSPLPPERCGKSSRPRSLSRTSTPPALARPFSIRFVDQYGCDAEVAVHVRGRGGRRELEFSGAGAAAGDRGGMGADDVRAAACPRREAQASRSVPRRSSATPSGRSRAAARAAAPTRRSSVGVLRRADVLQVQDGAATTRAARARRCRRPRPPSACSAPRLDAGDRPRFKALRGSARAAAPAGACRSTQQHVQPVREAAYSPPPAIGRPPLQPRGF